MHFTRLLFPLIAVSSAHALTIDMKPDGPVSTLAAARDAARQARVAGSNEAIIVRVADGVYPLSEAVVFEPQDSGVTYEAAAGARPVIVGGKRITGFQPAKRGSGRRILIPHGDSRRSGSMVGAPLARGRRTRAISRRRVSRWRRFPGRP